MSETIKVKPRQTKNNKCMLVHYSRMNTLGWFEHQQVSVPKVNIRVVVKTERGLELGHIVGVFSSYKSGQFRLSEEEVEEYFEDGDDHLSFEKVGKFIRYATAADISEEKHLEKIAEDEARRCRRFVKDLELPMKIVEAEHIFGGERIIFYFMADGRVDFRELVKVLAQEYQTRVEMRQIGSRDEAKLLGDVEACGQQCCCQRFLKILKPVNMRMAKMQKATLDPSKISGYCGRLKCCLRYEDQTYKELKKWLPKSKTKVKTKYGYGKVVETQILTQLVVVEHDGGTEKMALPLEEIEVVASDLPSEQKADNASNSLDGESK
ncbi:MAG: hypothetical protein JXB29_09115 [Sedimentisphaerales bacterium]|nr:hypothetical protein [Sedimentisphaerales bacterium]